MQVTQFKWYAVSAIAGIYGVLRVFFPDIVVPSEEEIASFVNGAVLIGAPAVVAFLRWLEKRQASKEVPPSA